MPFRSGQILFNNKFHLFYHPLALLDQVTGLGPLAQVAVNISLTLPFARQDHFSAARQFEELISKGGSFGLVHSLQRSLAGLYF